MTGLCRCAAVCRSTYVGQLLPCESVKHANCSVCEETFGASSSITGCVGKPNALYQDECWRAVVRCPRILAGLDRNPGFMPMRWSAPPRLTIGLDGQVLARLSWNSCVSLGLGERCDSDQSLLWAEGCPAHGSLASPYLSKLSRQQGLRVFATDVQQEH